MTDTPLAAIRFETEEIDSFLTGLVASFTRDGWRVRGVLQSRGVVSGDCHCADMDLTQIGTGRVFRISQPLGNGSHGCRLDPGALAQCAEVLDTELQRGADLLVLNRFGRGEAEGRGLRDLIAKAVLAGIPVLTAARATYLDAWRAFGADLACELPMRPGAVRDWAETFRRPTGSVSVPAGLSVAPATA